MIADNSLIPRASWAIIMSFTEKIDVLELLISLLHEHEQKLDSLVEKLEIVDKTIRQNPVLDKPSSEYEGTNLDDTPYQEILVVDDDENLANTFKLILEDVGFKVDTALTGLSAIHKMGKKKYDLVILDINLPDMLGYQIVEEMETKCDHTEFIYITGYSSLKNDFEVQRDEMEVLMKPIEPDKLVEVTTKHVRQVSIYNKKK